MRSTADKSIADVMKKLSSGEVIERSLELCVNCPLHGKNVPVDGNCFTSKVSKDQQPSFNVVKLHGNPLYYELKQKCEYALNAVSGMQTRFLRGVVCGYKPDTKLWNAHQNQSY